MMHGMMGDGSMGSMMWGMDLFGLLAAVVLLLAIAALVKYVFLRGRMTPPALKVRLGVPMAAHTTEVRASLGEQCPRPTPNSRIVGASERHLRCRNRGGKHD